jgi:hypothetical protein
VKVRVTSVERPGENREGREFDARLLRGGRTGLKTGHYNSGRWLRKQTQRGPMVPTGREKSATALKLSASRSGCATGMPGWRGESYFVC